MAEVALMAIGTGLRVAARSQRTRAQNDADARAAQRNAEIAEQQGYDERAAAAKKAAERRRDVKQRLATQTSLLAADGQAVDTGQAMDLSQDLFNRGEYLADLDQAAGDRAFESAQDEANFERKIAKRRIRGRSRTSLLNMAGDVYQGFSGMQGQGGGDEEGPVNLLRRDRGRSRYGNYYSG